MTTCTRSNVAHRHAYEAVSSAGSHIDPVCGMTVAENTATGSFAYGGNKYFFCSNHCLQLFKANPAAYVATSAATAGRHPLPALTSGAFTSASDKTAADGRAGEMAKDPDLRNGHCQGPCAQVRARRAHLLLL